MDENKKSRKSKRKKRKINNKRKRSIVIFFIIVVIFFELVSSNKKNTDLKLILNYIDITSDLSHQLFKTDDVVYMSMEDISRYIDNTIYQENNLIVSTSDFKVVSLEINSNVININGSEQSISGTAIMIDETVYLPISELEKVYNIKFKYSAFSNISIIENLANKKSTAIAKKKVSIKKEKNVFSKTLSKVKKGEVLVCIDEYDNWTKVMDNDGNMGFVKTNKLKDLKVEREKFESRNYVQDVSNDDVLEENISNEDIDTFNSRKNLIKKIFTKAIENEKKYVKIIFNSDNSNFERLKIEGRPIFNECGICVDFIGEENIE